MVAIWSLETHPTIISEPTMLPLNVKAKAIHPGEATSTY